MEGERAQRGTAAAGSGKAMRLRRQAVAAPHPRALPRPFARLQDEGGRSNKLVMVVAHPDARDLSVDVPLRFVLYYESGREVEQRDQAILNLCKPDYDPWVIPAGKGEVEVEFRLEKVSRRKDGQRFRVFVAPADPGDATPSDAEAAAAAMAVRGVQSIPICVMSKRRTGERIVSRRAPARVASSGSVGAGADDIEALHSEVQELQTSVANLRSTMERNFQSVMSMLQGIAAQSSSAAAAAAGRAHGYAPQGATGPQVAHSSAATHGHGYSSYHRAGPPGSQPELLFARSSLGSHVGGRLTVQPSGHVQAQQSNGHPVMAAHLSAPLSAMESMPVTSSAAYGAAPPLQGFLSSMHSGPIPADRSAPAVDPPSLGIHPAQHGPTQGPPGMDGASAISIAAAQLSAAASTTAAATAAASAAARAAAASSATADAAAGPRRSGRNSIKRERSAGVMSTGSIEHRAPTRRDEGFGTRKPGEAVGGAAAAAAAAAAEQDEEDEDDPAAVLSAAQSRAFAPVSGGAPSDLARVPSLSSQQIDHLPSGAWDTLQSHAPPGKRTRRG